MINDDSTTTVSPHQPPLFSIQELMSHISNLQIFLHLAFLISLFYHLESGQLENWKQTTVKKNLFTIIPALFSRITELNHIRSEANTYQ